LELIKITDDDKEKELLTNELNKDIDELEINTYLSGPYDNLNVYLEIHPGAGGTESCDWASMLLRMYERFCEIYNYKYEEISLNKGEEAGIKSVLIKISGEYVYGYLKNENGVHRLVRISPFDANKRRHTSFASVMITPEFNFNVDIDIKEEDLKIDVYHSSGAGGQSVNTSNSAVRITHLPSKIVVTCQNERSQLKNKEQALKILKNRLYEKELEKQESFVSGLKQDDMSINFGSQIRSYFLEPYKLVKDHRTGFENSDPMKILDGYIMDLLEYNLKVLAKNNIKD
jgi:peptide chain release factor 2